MFNQCRSDRTNKNRRLYITRVPKPEVKHRFLSQNNKKEDGIHFTNILRNCFTISGTPKISGKFFSELVGILPTI